MSWAHYVQPCGNTSTFEGRNNYDCRQNRNGGGGMQNRHSVPHGSRPPPPPRKAMAGRGVRVLTSAAVCSAVKGPGT